MDMKKVFFLLATVIVPNNSFCMWMHIKVVEKKIQRIEGTKKKVFPTAWENEIINNENVDFFKRFFLNSAIF